MQKSQSFTSIQCLRAIAALLVLWGHLKFVLKGHKWEQLSFVSTAAGAVGVDVFFVISGFVMGHTISKSQVDWRTFAVHRAARVIPYYWLISIFFLIIGILHDYLVFTSLFNSVFFLPLFDFGAFSNTIHPFGWTLCFEIWFYALLVLCLLFFGTQARGVVLFVMFLGVLVTSLFYDSMWVLPRFVFCPIILEFCAGLFLQSFYKKINVGIGSILIGFACLLFFIAVLYTQKLGNHNLVLADFSAAWMRTLIWGSFSILLVLFCLCQEKRRKLFPLWLQRLGDASYSLYLVQAIVMAVCIKLNFYINPALNVLLFIIGSLVIAIFCYIHIEKPITKWVRIRLEKVLIRRKRSE